jgi:hypothetical protein
MCRPMPLRPIGMDKECSDAPNGRELDSPTEAGLPSLFYTRLAGRTRHHESERAFV